MDSHANTAIHDFMNGSLDVAKNSILSTTGQAISWDENGLRLRKWNSDRTGYEDEQIWMKDNLIVFTEDAWEHAKMAIGHIHDEELGDLWGVIADSIVGKLLAGENLIIMGTDSTGKKTLFRVDGSGMYAYNSRFWMESVNGGAFAVDPSFGLGLGQGNPFVVGADGTIVPKCIDPSSGELKLDNDGFPVGMNFWAGLDGQVYIRGNIYATDGVFNGVVKATDFQLPSGDSMVSILNSDKKIKSDWLDLMGINIKNDAGQTVMTIDQSGVKFGTGFSPVTYQYSVDGTSDWHYTMTANDKYRRESYDSGGTWGDGYQFKGVDGANGTVNYNRVNQILKETYGITTTYITEGAIGSPVIQGAKIYGGKIYAGGNSNSFSEMDDNGLNIYIDGISEPKVQVTVRKQGEYIFPWIELGSGSASSPGNENKGFWGKGTSGMSLYYIDSTGNQSGFTFKSNGEIDVIGTLNGVHAVLA